MTTNSRASRYLPLYPAPIRRFLPQFRLNLLARRLMTDYPNPPRPVDIGDVLGVYGPTFGYAAFIILVFIGFLLIEKPRGGLPTTAAISAILVLGYGAIAGRFVMSVLGALRKAVYATAEITSVSGRTVGCA